MGSLTPSGKLTRFSVAPLATMTRHLADVASGRSAADLVIAGARVLSTYSERMLPDREVWIAGGRVAAVRPAGSHRNGPAPGTVYDAKGGIIAPGLIDPHMHIESSMVTACAYAEAALLNGTTTIFCDSHEIGNVLDAEGIEMMLEDARQAPLSIFLTVPSTVPATTPELETAGGDLTPEKIGKLLDKWPEAVALGEKMDFVSVVHGDERSHAILAAALSRGRPVSGHIYGREFVAAYAASGVTDTHEAIDRDIADDLLDAGVWVFLRGGNPETPWNSIVEAVKTVTELGASTERVCVCTDDRDADDLMHFGLDWVTREAVRVGLSKVQAWSAGSLHPATRYAMDGEIGGLGGGRRADLVLIDDDLNVRNTWYGGVLAVEDRKITPVVDKTLSERYRYPAKAYATIKIKDTLKLTPDLPARKSVVNAIGIALPGIVAPHRRIEIEPANDWSTILEPHNLTFVSVIERHGKGGSRVAHGMLHDFRIKSGAVASSVGHDSHNLIVAGTNEADMQLAVRTVAAANGGVCVVDGGEVKAMVALPIAGLLSDKRAPVVAEETRALKAAWEAAGCHIPYMGFNLLPLSVIPELRITDKGLVLVNEMRILPLFEAAN
jgi:adenine deaminase